MFVSGASTTINLVDCIFDWNLALSRKKSLDVLYIDLSKAFDKVSHAKLTSKLEAIAVGGAILSWFCSYLQDRYMTVKVHYKFSDAHRRDSGVPQDGVLSPTLFLIYTLDFPSLLKTTQDIEVRMYADE